MKWHATFREKCTRSGTIEPGYYTKWGRYKPEERLKADQSPVPFVVNRKRVYDYVPPREGATHNTWIAQSVADIKKRKENFQ